jgi:hypothetical protein
VQAFENQQFDVTQLSVNANRGVSTLVRDQHSRNACTSQGRNDPGDQSRKSDFGDTPALAWSKLTQNPNLNANRADVAKAANSVGCDESRAS